MRSNTHDLLVAFASAMLVPANLIAVLLLMARISNSDPLNWVVHTAMHGLFASGAWACFTIWYADRGEPEIEGGRLEEEEADAE